MKLSALIARLQAEQASRGDVDVLFVGEDVPGHYGYWDVFDGFELRTIYGNESPAVFGIPKPNDGG